MNNLSEARREVIEISPSQVQSFLGNVLEVVLNDGERGLVLSQSAKGSLTSTQKEQFARAGIERFLSSPLPTIERVGGGSARCMIADIRTPPHAIVGHGN